MPVAVVERFAQVDSAHERQKHEVGKCSGLQPHVPERGNQCHGDKSQEKSGLERACERSFNQVRDYGAHSQQRRATGLRSQPLERRSHVRESRGEIKRKLDKKGGRYRERNPGRDILLLGVNVRREGSRRP
jgi:hypothetical protein